VFGTTQGRNGVQGNSGNQNASGVYGENMSGGYGVAGRTNGADRPGVFGHNIGGGEGVRGEGLTGVSGSSSDPSGVGTGGTNNVGPNAIGVQGSSTQGTGVRGMTFEGTGVLGICTTSGRGTRAVAVHGIRTGSGLAGRFDGDVRVNGTLSKSAGAFLIDHPLDPANKYLRHSFVESPDMLNIYNGVAMLDTAGEATVELPDWFEALNQEFRYALTPIGGPGPNVHIAQEVEGNNFRIGGGSPGMKISWQITGVRHDPYALMHPVVVEENKSAWERGTYLHPEEYGVPSPLGSHNDPGRQANGHKEAERETETVVSTSR